MKVTRGVKQQSRRHVESKHLIHIRALRWGSLSPCLVHAFFFNIDVDSCDDARAKSVNVLSPAYVSYSGSFHSENHFVSTSCKSLTSKQHHNTIMLDEKDKGGLSLSNTKRQCTWEYVTLGL